MHPNGSESWLESDRLGSLGRNGGRFHLASRCGDKCRPTQGRVLCQERTHGQVERSVAYTSSSVIPVSLCRRPNPATPRTLTTELELDPGLEDYRGPGRFPRSQGAAESARFWSAPVLWRFGTQELTAMRTRRRSAPRK